jgi:hypothetical protein
MLKASRESVRASMRSAGTDPARTGLDEEIDAALEWVAAGCPPDTVRGFYPDSSGRGGALRLLQKTTFSESSVVSWDGVPGDVPEDRQGEGPMNP